VILYEEICVVELKTTIEPTLKCRGETLVKRQLSSYFKADLINIYIKVSVKLSTFYEGINFN